MFSPPTKQEVLYIEEIYIWLSMIEDLTYSEYKKMLENFGSLELIYKISKTSFLFSKYLEDFKINLSQKVYNQITNFNLKENSNEIYNFLKNSEIDIIVLENKFLEILPLVVFLKGNKNILNESKKIFILKNKDTNKRIQYIKFSNYLKEVKKYEIIFESDIQVKGDNNKKIIVLNSKLSKEKIKEIQNTKLCDSLILFSIKNITQSNLEKFNMHLIALITKTVIVLESRYNPINVNFVDEVLNYGKDVYVVPQSIEQKSNFFSNYLIKSGADIIISIKDLDNI